ncbi:hypothetical protein H8F21_14055 [Pseudomonas sp. P66]|uniref:YiaAB two helix domain-containing protein n=1 Tax=Pseudomonas arcuscaelestis TaxID=2710591 RepID=A0ABS2BYJ5_9PSED|nr:hypothetical protein [Pseudomonas arcuscaelestis]MBM5458688.1 hypothetical protein [Pseudomonas arcuscaelestis]
MEAPSRHYPTHPNASATTPELQAIRRKVDIISMTFTVAAFALGIAAYQWPSALGRFIGLMGMIACVFTATYSVDRGDGISNLLRKKRSGTGALTLTPVVQPSEHAA